MEHAKKFELVEWSAKILVGLPNIDAQHRQLFELAATFGGDGDQIRVLKSLAMLTEYVKVHLREEEQMMAACEYPGLEAHRQLHAEFRRMLFKLLEDAKRMTLDEIADEVKFLINGWFYNHIMVADFDYVPSVKAAAGARPHRQPER
ncbi:MAG: hemerythrin family protein [Candidatus Accumulibacter sp.]|uniref:bacteriohemerythrin n=1 Tax=Accumulibacter sp. TaxID=2053492 RepID=UPI0019E9052B|nr:hemerythrin family protein [Accumulibacter sp.]MBE2257479.1 hemerythrin family protein [Paracoccaceae bacterium]MCB1940688.1 hemerythrin family protein [Accumulibacter sp.]MCP5249465.1 hemerythrin family protein [Accumulibacter sp.]